MWYDYALSCECVMRCDVMSMNDDVDVHCVTMGIITHNFKRDFEERGMRGIHCEIPIFKSFMGNEKYF